MIIFDGSIDEGNEAVLIVTTLWEWDKTNKKSALDKWESWISGYMLPYVKRYPEKFLNASPPGFGASDNIFRNTRMLSSSKYGGNYGLNPVAYIRSDIGQTHPLNITCPDNTASNLHFYPTILVLNGRTGVALGTSQMYAISARSFCSPPTLALSSFLSSSYYMFTEVERLN